MPFKTQCAFNPDSWHNECSDLLHDQRLHSYWIEGKPIHKSVIATSHEHAEILFRQWLPVYWKNGTTGLRSTTAKLLRNGFKVVRSCEMENI